MAMCAAKMRPNWSSRSIFQAPPHAKQNSRRHEGVDGIVDRRADLRIFQIPHHREVGGK